MTLTVGVEGTFAGPRAHERIVASQQKQITLAERENNVAIHEHGLIEREIALHKRATELDKFAQELQTYSHRFQVKTKGLLQVMIFSFLLWLLGVKAYHSQTVVEFNSYTEERLRTMPSKSPGTLQRGNSSSILPSSEKPPCTFC